ncbi:MAG TPA: AmmeMemoRadiSam system protein B [Burkholderiales bacterium]|nr:AmmeMemoRadiSam system protein B [Burkholderiales bacterium]
MAAVRPAAVAGTFYPGNASSLAAEVDDLLAGAEALAPRVGFPKAIIVPHAGYIYSGAVAAGAYDAVRPGRGIVRRVVLLGPVHRVPVRGLAATSDEAFATPLGSIPIDREALRSVGDLPQVVTSDAAHALEHSLEVQLPFLQKTLGDFSLVPFAVGMASVADVAQVIGRLWGGPETLIVISTDLSHYHPYDEARSIDDATISRITAFATDLDHDEACGATPLNGLLLVSKQKNLSLKLLAACNSGDTAGGRDRVVGYSSFGLYEGAEPSLDDAGKMLIAIARNAIESELFEDRQLNVDAPWLDQCAATFVTLTRDGQLRGCIGSLEAARPLRLDVAQNAVGAAFRDPRFPRMAAGDWPRCRVEVSLLSAPKRLEFADESDLLEQLEPGLDGVILECDGRRSTFLPQVWESLPDKRAFLVELVKKAGLPADTRLARCRISRYRVAKFHEG